MDVLPEAEQRQLDAVIRLVRDVLGDAALGAYRLRSQPIPPLRVSPPTPVSEIRPPGVASPNATVGLTSGSYTNGMKTAVSVPDDVFEGAERLAHREGRSRSEVYSAALREYVARHDPDDLMEALDRVVAEVGEEIDPFVTASSQHTLESSEW